MRDSFAPPGDAWLRSGRVLCIFLSAVSRNAVFCGPCDHGNGATGRTSVQLNGPS